MREYKIKNMEILLNAKLVTISPELNENKLKLYSYFFCSLSISLNK